jgi:hypothetical protein
MIKCVILRNLSTAKSFGVVLVRSVAYNAAKLRKVKETRLLPQDRIEQLIRPSIR